MNRPEERCPLCDALLPPSRILLHYDLVHTVPNPHQAAWIHSNVPSCHSMGGGRVNPLPTRNESPSTSGKNPSASGNLVQCYIILALYMGFEGNFIAAKIPGSLHNWCCVVTSGFFLDIRSKTQGEKIKTQAQKTQNSRFFCSKFKFPQIL